MKRLKGFTLIELLIVVAIIAILAAIAVPNFLEAQTRAKVSRVRSDQRTYATALEAYYIDNNAYPAFSGGAGDVGGPSANSGPIARNGGATVLDDLPTFRTKAEPTGNNYDNVMTLTTPVSYVTSYFTDAFTPVPGATFIYSPCITNLTPGAGWILLSPGPDRNYGGGGDVFSATGNTVNVEGDPVIVVEETIYSCNSSAASEVLTNRTYDPTNGTNSTGDVYRLKQ